MVSSGGSASPTTGSRKVVMKYDEKEELEATGEWLFRIKSVGFAEDLMYVPSELTKMGVIPPPVDVVNRLNRLRENDHVADTVDHDIVEASAERASSSVLLLERPKDVETPLVFDYDNFGPWEWAEPLEKMVENSIKSVLAPEPGLDIFNELASLAYPVKRARGKRVRSNVRPTT